MEADPRELIVEIYRQISEFGERKVQPSRVVMSAQHYRTIQHYHAHLGELPDGAFDYIAQYRIFGLEICIDALREPTVE